MIETQKFRPLRIAQISSLPGVGGAEDAAHVVSGLSTQLVERGHQVTLFGVHDVVPGARLVAPTDRRDRHDPTTWERSVYESMIIDAVMERRNEFDVIHNHLGVAFYPFARTCEAPVVSTVHGRLDRDGMQALYEHFNDMLFVSTSNAQRAAVPNAHFVATVYDGIVEGDDAFQSDGEYLAYFGAIREEMGVDDAVRVALGAKIPIRIAAPPHSIDRDYFDTWIDPLFEHPLVQWAGELEGQQRGEFLGDALAFVFMVDWPDPSGLPLIESMASGTPVIARRGGASDEVVDEGITGYVVEDVHEAVESTRSLRELAPDAVRERFRARFSAAQMSAAYERLYRAVIAGHAEPLGRRGIRSK